MTTRRGGGECLFFLGRKSRGAFGQPAFFLAGNRMTMVAFEKEVSEKLPKSVLCISKSARILNNGNPQNLCHIVKHAWCLFVFNLDGLK